MGEPERAHVRALVCVCGDPGGYVGGGRGFQGRDAEGPGSETEEWRS